MINIKNVSVCYKLVNDRVTSLKEYVISILKHKIVTEKFWALKDVSFTVEKGDVIGIVGRNGAGKSTLLKIVSGIQKPASGSVELGGNVVPMLELGAGFDFELSGRENVYLNGAVLGYTKEFIDSRYDAIVSFAELEQFMSTPVRNYSSGMVARLAFSIASQVNPDILIVDEVLSVGDENFQKKSRQRMVELMGGGSTVLFVSHSTAQIREICNKAVWLDHGHLVRVGEANEICDAYQEFLDHPERGTK
jgi:ABC-type polysaccharide/polyol phosphate transport system ATPase subunit